MADEHKTMAKTVELLSISTGEVDRQPLVLLSLRTNPNSFKVTTIALSASQARRLLDDLVSRFNESAILSRLESTDPELRLAYHRIMSEEKGITVGTPPHE